MDKSQGKKIIEKIAASVKDVEDTHRAHGRAVARHHKLLEELGNEHGAEFDLTVASVVPKNPNEIEE